MTLRVLCILSMLFFVPNLFGAEQLTPNNLDKAVEEIVQQMPLNITQLNKIMDGKLPKHHTYINTGNVRAYFGRMEQYTELKDARVNGFWVEHILMEERSDGGIFISIRPSKNRCYSPDYLLSKYFDVNKPYSSYPERITYDYKSPRDDWLFFLGMATNRPKCINFISIINGTYSRRTPF